MKLWPVLTGIALSFTLIACKAPTPPKGVQPITNFDANRYLGKWYEIARLESPVRTWSGTGQRYLWKTERRRDSCT